jgi:hypothetical protein
MTTNFSDNVWDRFWSKLRFSVKEDLEGLVKNPKWFLMRKFSRFSGSLPTQEVLEPLTFNTSQTALGRTDSYFQNVDVDSVVETLRQDGLCLDIYLPQAAVQEILEYAYSTPCFASSAIAERSPDLGFYYHQKSEAEKSLSKKIALARYFNTGSDCPAIQKLQSDPVLLEIARKYLDAKPVHQGNRLYWNFATKLTRQEKSATACMFHYDVDDYRCLKFFFYLTNVDELGGPHVCVRGSHKKKKLKHFLLRKREEDQDIVDYYGADAVEIICGQPGYGFVEYPLCFHKATAPIDHDRLLLQVQFARNDYGILHDTTSLPQKMIEL